MKTIFTFFTLLFLICACEQQPDLSTYTETIKIPENTDSLRNQAEIAQFKSVVDSIFFGTDSVNMQALQKLNFLKKRFGNVDNLWIKNTLARYENSAFVNVNLHYPNEYIECLENEAFPKSRRAQCLLYLIDKAISVGDFALILEFGPRYNHQFDQPGFIAMSCIDHVIDSTRYYFQKVAQIEALGLPADSLFYARAWAIQSICKGRNCSSGCAGYDFSPIYKQLEGFTAKFSNSQLCDNVQWDLFYTKTQETCASYQCYIDQFKRWQKKYPDSDIIADAQCDLFFFLFETVTEETNEGLLAQFGNDFIKKFPNDKRAESIKSCIKDYIILK
ncbi:MAG: hypothetical protein R2792_19060 [Saprospiraceae bacterium]